MKPFTELVNDPIWEDDRPWLIAGSGPSLDLWEPSMKSRFRVFGINRATLVTEPDISFHMDYGPMLYVLSKMVPRRMLVSTILHKYDHGQWDFDTFVAATPGLQQLDSTGALFAFTPMRYHPDAADVVTPEIRVGRTSGEAVLAILAALGEKMVYTIGIDSCRGHAVATEETNTDFDYAEQDGLLSHICQTTGIRFERLTSENL